MQFKLDENLPPSAAELAARARTRDELNDDFEEVLLRWRERELDQRP